MMVAFCVLVLAVGCGLAWAAGREGKFAPSRKSDTRAPDLDGLLRELDTRRQAPRQEMASVRGREGSRRHVWCSPHGDEVFLN